LIELQKILLEDFNSEKLQHSPGILYQTGAF